jgi:hypothetical protein
MPTPAELAAVAAQAEATLSDFEGHKVRRALIAIHGAGDGLSAAMAVRPQEFPHGKQVVVILRCVVEDVSHPPLDKDKLDGDLARKHKLKAITATVADDVTAKKVQKSLDTQADLIERAVDAAAGKMKLAGIDDPPSSGTDADDDPADL